MLVLDVVFGGQQAGLQPGQPDDCWYGQAILQISHSGELYIRYIGAWWPLVWPGYSANLQLRSALLRRYCAYTYRSQIIFGDGGSTPTIFPFIASAFLGMVVQYFNLNVYRNIFALKYILESVLNLTIFHSWAQRKLSPLSPLNPLDILLSINGPLLSYGFNGLKG